MNGKFQFYRFSALPAKDMRKESFFEIIGKSEFVLVYDLQDRSTLIGMQNDVVESKVEELQKIIPGMRMGRAQCNQFDVPQSFDALSFYKKLPGSSDHNGRDEREMQDEHSMHDLFELAKEGFLAVVFIPVENKELNETKDYLEKTLSKKSVRETHSILKNTPQSRVNVSSQMDVFTESEEVILLSDVLRSINDAILGNGLVYKTFFIIPRGASKVHEFINTRFLVLGSYESRTSFDPLLTKLRANKSLPFGIDHLMPLVDPYGVQRLSYTLPTLAPTASEGVEVGTFMRAGAVETSLSVRIAPSTMNLGFIITGLPGSGKTTEAMAIIDSLLKEHDESIKPKVIVITPTTEWDHFAISHGMYLIKPYNDMAPMNLFRRPQGIDKEKFYESLANVLSSASSAGPYQNPMEKCMLNAFRKIYADEEEPDPVVVYDEIENSIIELHAKRTNSGVKYTKHGENIRSALENLRGILSRPEFSVRAGIKIEDLLCKGAVYNISSASGTTRAYLYALLLNQVYAITSALDAKGDGELRLLICLEEAQTMFGDKESAAVRDIKQRIQDFRRQGIGLMLLTHNVNDIETGVRRLCQTKLYLKQASDVAAIASKDLVFTYANEDDVTMKLKLLDSRVGAFSYVTKAGAEKMVQDTVFIKTKEYNNKSAQIYENPLDALIKNSALALPKVLNATICIEANQLGGQSYHPAASIGAVRLKYLGETIAEHAIGDEKGINQPMLEGKTYKLQILDKRGRILKESSVKASNKITISISEDKVVTN